MVIVRLKGGMGNQMFQYALGRRLSLDLKAPLKLDISGFDDQSNVETSRHYDLHHFNIVEEFAGPKEIKRMKWQVWKNKIFRQFHIGYEPKILKKKGDVYLDGFFHNEKYFQSIRETLLWEFNLKVPLSAAGEAAAIQIRSRADLGTMAISLHVRRGDFASDPTTQKYHGLMTTEYYGGAIEILKSKLGQNIEIFVFSDDIEWVKKHIPFSDPHYYVTDPANIPYPEEVYLMSICAHNIIANSSFSWWGAWLNQNPNKIVIAPKKWLAKTGNDYYHEIPDSWIKI